MNLKFSMKEEETPAVVAKTRSKKGLIIRILIGLAFVLLAGAATYFYLQTVQLSKNPKDVADQQLKETVAKVSRLIILPPNETPTLASVSDPRLLKNQPFFDKAQKGDQVLIYSTAKQAILYRPSENVIVNVASVNLGGTDATPGSTPPPPPASPATNAPKTAKK